MDIIFITIHENEDCRWICAHFQVWSPCLGLHNDMCAKYIIIYVICFLFQGCASVCHKELCPHPGNWTF